MPPKYYTCEICGNLVSRRESLALENLNGQSGRACRHHSEVIDILQKQKQEKIDQAKVVRLCSGEQATHCVVWPDELKNSFQEISRTMSVISTAEGMRMMHSIHKIPESELIAKLKKVAPDEQFVHEVLDHIEKAGGFLLSQKEIDNAIMMSIVLAKRQLDRASQPG